MNITKSWLRSLDVMFLEKMLGAFGEDIDKKLTKELRKRKLLEIKRARSNKSSGSQ